MADGHSCDVLVVVVVVISGDGDGGGDGWGTYRCHAPNTFGTVNMECTVDSRLSWSEQ